MSCAICGEDKEDLNSEDICLDCLSSLMSDGVFCD